MLTTLLFALVAQASSTVGVGRITLVFDAYGEHVRGEVVFDGDALAARGIVVGRGVLPAEYGMSCRTAAGETLMIRESTDAFLVLDRDGDGDVDAADGTLAAVSLHVDDNVDGDIQPHELRTLESLGVAHVSRTGAIRFHERERMVAAP